MVTEVTSGSIPINTSQRNGLNTLKNISDQQQKITSDLDNLKEEEAVKLDVSSTRQDFALEAVKQSAQTGKNVANLISQTVTGSSLGSNIDISA